MFIQRFTFAAHSNLLPRSKPTVCRRSVFIRNARSSASTAIILLDGTDRLTSTTATEGTNH
jgi:hypothetical protein